MVDLGKYSCEEFKVPLRHPKSFLMGVIKESNLDSLRWKKIKSFFSKEKRSFDEHQILVIGRNVGGDDLGAAGPCHRPAIYTPPCFSSHSALPSFL